MIKDNKQTKRNADAIVRFATERSKSATWIELHNAIFGIGGLATERFPSEADRVAFAKTGALKKVQAIIDGLRDEGEQGDLRSSLADMGARTNGAISVRVPRSVHAALLAEAKSEGVSLNQLCVVKLAVQLQSIV